MDIFAFLAQFNPLFLIGIAVLGTYWLSIVSGIIKWMVLVPH